MYSLFWNRTQNTVYMHRHTHTLSITTFPFTVDLFAKKNEQYIVEYFLQSDSAIVWVAHSTDDPDQNSNPCPYRNSPNFATIQSICRSLFYDS